MKKTNCQTVGYDLPSTQSKRSTGFGFGSKEFAKGRNDSPPPGAYNQSSDFEKRNKGSMFSFGIAREAYSKVY